MSELTDRLHKIHAIHGFRSCKEGADELEHMQEIIDRVALLRLELESENLRLTKENERLEALVKEYRDLAKLSIDSLEDK